MTELAQDSATARDDSLTQAPPSAPSATVVSTAPTVQGTQIDGTEGSPCSFSHGGLNPQALTESGVAAPAGFFWSEVQHDTGNLTESNTAAGSSPLQGSFRLADNFTLSQPCTLTSVVFYAYQTGSPATPSPFTGYTLQIHNGRPGDPGEVVVFGDTTTNRLASSVDSTFFRIFNTAVPPPGTVQGTTRKIWKNTVTIGTTLPAGTYWFDWDSTVTAGAAHFQPGKTIAGSRGAVGDNSRQLVTGAWTDVIDVGNPASAPDVPQDFPFDVVGTPTGGGTPTPTPCPPGWAAGAPFPAVAGVRAAGVYFPANGRFYAMGGRSADVAGADFTNPFEYNPATNTWATKVATYPDNLVNNMACGVLTVGGTPQIYCVGGNASQVVGTASLVSSATTP